MAFMPDGDLLLAASFEGQKGLFRFSPVSAGMEHYVAALLVVWRSPETICSSPKSVAAISDS
jgi:hypothetical protein